MRQYLELVQNILDNGSWQENRTGIRTLSIPGAMMRFDLQQGFPAVTTKKLAFKSTMGELVGFLRGYRSAADFRALGTKVWDQNANENQQWLTNPYRLQDDDMGSVYGVQWRQWPAYKLIDLSEQRSEAQIADAMNCGYQQIGAIEDIGENGKTTCLLLYKAIDQLRECLDTIMKDPSNRRIKIQAIEESFFMAGIWPSLKRCHCRHAICFTSSSSTNRSVRFRCACTFGQTILASGRRSTWPKAPPCCIWLGA